MKCLVAWREGEAVTYSFSGSACANWICEKENLKRIFRICSSFGWVSRIDIALDTLPIILYLGLENYFIKNLERWNLLVKSAVLT